MLQDWGIGFNDNTAQFQDHFPATPTAHPQYRVSIIWLYR